VANIALSATAPGDLEFEGQEASVGFEVPSAPSSTHAAVENMKRVELTGLYLTGHELQASGGTPRMQLVARRLHLPRTIMEPSSIARNDPDGRETLILAQGAGCYFRIDFRYR
jgi:hypothetical protein